jgi:transketolase
VETEKETIQRLRDMSKQMRLQALEMALQAGNNGAHLGPAFSCVEIFSVLYGKVMRYRVSDPEWSDRDRMIASKAHCVLAHYTALAEVGFISEDDLATFEKNGTFLAGHPSMYLEHGLEYAGGSLGMALSVGIGMALDAKSKKRENKIYILLGDGECDEGSNWEAFMAASHFKLENLVAVVDKNMLQYDGTTDEIMSLGNLRQKMESFGWSVTTVDGHNIKELLEAFSCTFENMPHVIIANTIKGKGVSFMENSREWHHSRLTRQQYEAAVAEVQRE